MSEDEKKPGQKPGDDKNEAKVIPFPVDRVKGRRRLKKLAGQLGDNRKTTLFLSLLSVMVVSYYLLNGGVEPSGIGRDIASSDKRSRDKESALVDLLSQWTGRSPASYGRKPSSEEEFKSEFTGRYRILYHFDTGLVTSVQYEESLLGNSLMLDVLRQKHDGDLSQFLRRYSANIHPGYDDVRIDLDSIGLKEGDLTSEVYLLLREGSPVARVVFSFQQDNVFISMKVESIPKQ